MERKRSYFRVRLGPKHEFVQQCREESCIGSGEIAQDLTREFPCEWPSFHAKFFLIRRKEKPGETKTMTGLVCGGLFMMFQSIQKNDIVLCLDGQGNFWAGEVTGDYTYTPGQALCHRRSVRWLPRDSIAISETSNTLKAALAGGALVQDLSNHTEEVERLLGDVAAPELTAADPDVEDPSVFALERHLEDFLVANWSSTELGKTHDLKEEDGEVVGQQYPTDVGFIDLLAVSKDRKELLVIELKKGRTSDIVVGQTLRYMGCVMKKVAEPHQIVRGCIIALEDDLNLRYALYAAANIDFYRYRVDFQLIKSEANPAKA